MDGWMNMWMNIQEVSFDLPWRRQQQHRFSAQGAMAVALLPQTPWRVVVLSRGSTALFPSRIPLPHVLTRNPLHTGFASHTKEWRSCETRAGIHIDRRRHFDELWRRQEVIFFPLLAKFSEIIDQQTLPRHLHQKTLLWKERKSLHTQITRHKQTDNLLLSPRKNFYQFLLAVE